MGRHRSTLASLTNSPNPWKHGSAKRVVRALDYSNVDVEKEAAAKGEGAHRACHRRTTSPESQVWAFLNNPSFQ